MGFAMRCSNRSRPSGGFLCRPNFGISAPLIESEPNGGRGVTAGCSGGTEARWGAHDGPGRGAWAATHRAGRVLGSEAVPGLKRAAESSEKKR